MASSDQAENGAKVGRGVEMINGGQGAENDANVGSGETMANSDQGARNDAHVGRREEMGNGDGAENDAAAAEAKRKAIEDWLPVTASREAKWWYSAFHNLTAMVGAGVLSLPYAMSQMGWPAGSIVLILSWFITLFTLWQMVEMHEMVPGVRFDRYHELGQHAFGEKLGLWIVVPQQLLVEVGTCIAYMVTGGKSLKKFHDTVCHTCKDIRTSYWILIFASVNFVLCLCPNLNSISAVSLAAAAMSIA